MDFHCNDCGHEWTGVEGDECPECGSDAIEELEESEE